MSTPTNQFITNRGPIIGAGSRGGISARAIPLPQVGRVLRGWFRPLIVGIYSTQIENGMVVLSTVREVATAGHLQPGSPEVLKQLPEGNRSWKNYDFWALPGLNIDTDDEIQIADVKYRVMNSLGYAEYGYDKYTLLEAIK